MSDTAITHQAERRRRSGVAGDPLIAQQGRITPAYLITAPDGTPAGWFVGITVADQLAGFLQSTAQ